MFYKVRAMHVGICMINRSSKEWECSIEVCVGTALFLTYDAKTYTRVFMYTISSSFHNTYSCIFFYPIKYETDKRSPLVQALRAYKDCNFYSCNKKIFLENFFRFGSLALHIITLFKM